MTFELNQYSRVVWTSIGSIIWFLLLFIFGTISLIKSTNRGYLANKIFFFIFMLGLVIMSVVSGYPTLKNGGIAFLKEKNSEALVCQGEIESITEISELIPNHHSFGSDIVIDGVTYVAVEEGEFKVGDIVEIHYLENSKFILKIEKQNNE